MIIGLAGYAKSGKDTAADFLEEITGFSRFAYADKTKEFIGRVFDISLDYFYKQNMKMVHLSFVLDRKDFYSKFVKTCDEVLGLNGNTATLLYDSMLDVFLQNDVIVSMNDTNFYISSTSRQLMQLIGTDVFRSYDDEFWIKFRPSDIDLIISDVRFHNEAQDVTGDGILILIDRDIAKEVKMNHESENLDIGDSYIIVDNNSTLEELKIKLTTIFENHKDKH